MNDKVKTFLKTAIRHELNLAQTLYDLLAQEQKYLEKRHVEGLNQCNEEKVKILSEIDQSSQRRLKVLGLRSITPNHIQLFEAARPVLRLMSKAVFGFRGVGVEFGNGEPLGFKTIRYIHKTINQHVVDEPWMDDDFMIVDNIACMHGRAPFKGEREVTVGMFNP